MRSARLSRTLALSTCVLIVTLAVVACASYDQSTVQTRELNPSELSLAQVEVPDLVGMDYSDASATLQSLGLGISGVHYPVLDGWEDYPVLEQDPEAGTLVAVYSTVEITYASPGDYLPDLVGMAEPDACDLIGNNQTVPWHLTRVYATTPLSDYWGVVMAQSPAPGTLWAMSPPVTVVIGQRSEVHTVPTLPGSVTVPTPSSTTTCVYIVPGVVGMSEEKAIGALNAHGFFNVDVTYVTTLTPSKMGKVIEQNPQSGAGLLDQGQLVQLKVGWMTPPMSESAE